MSDEDDDAAVAVPSLPQGPGAHRDPGPPAPPPRPPLSNLTPPPLKPPVAPPGAITASRSLLIASFLVGLLAIGLAFVTRADLLKELQQVIGDRMPDETDATVERTAAVVFWAAMAGLVIVIVAQSLLLRLVMNRRRGSRWVLLFFLAVHAAVAIVAGGFLGVGDAGLFLVIFLGGQLVLAGIAGIVSVLPGTARWFRAEH